MANQGTEVLIQSDPEVDHYLRLYRFMRDYHVLPRAGGVLEQDADLIFILEYIEQVLNDLKGQGNA
ncbi:MAG: hypothetical protein ACPLPW_08220 [bacterium]